jgi:hypothetical protein
MRILISVPLLLRFNRGHQQELRKGRKSEILNVTKLRSMLVDKKNKQSLQGKLSTNWHNKEVSTLMDHFQGDTKKLG